MDLRQMQDAMDAIRELHSKPLATSIKAGQMAYPKLQTRLAGPRRNGKSEFTSLIGIPVHVLAPESWPSNLVAVLDQKGNAMSAWIIND